MPGPALHHLIAERLKSLISQNQGLGASFSASEYAQLQAMLADPQKLPYLFLGCQGPDFLFFNLKDLDPTLGKFVNFYLEVSDFFEKFKRDLLKVVPQPVLDALAAFDEAANEVITDSALLSELKQTFEDINRLLDSLLPTLIEMVKKYLTEFNLFELISHPYRDGVKEGEWWWFDVLHYRKTGKFVKALLDNTAPGSPEHLYALGYLTHFTGDTVGHPYVNIMSGGPYRAHAQRHKTAENYQDVFNFLGETGQDFNRSKFHAFYNFNFNGAINDSEPDTFTNLPGDLAILIANTITQVYRSNEASGEKYGRSISPDEVNDAYKLYYKWFKNSTDSGTLPYPVPYSLSAELREVWEKAMNNLGAAGDFLENATNEAGNWGFLSIFIILAALIISAIMAATALADAIAGSIATLGTSTIRYAACLIYEQVYNAFQNFRLGTSLNGLAFPMIEHLTEPRLRQFQSPNIPDPTGAIASHYMSTHPRFKFVTDPIANPLATLFHQERHLIYPFTGCEQKSVMGAPQDYYTALSTHYAYGTIPISDSFIDELVNLSNDINPANNDDGELHGAILDNRENRLGSGIDLAENIYDRWRINRPIPDFNLDGDRGYGYLCWSQMEELPPPDVEESDSPQKLRAEDDPSSNLPCENQDEVKLRFIQ